MVPIILNKLQASVIKDNACYKGKEEIPPLNINW